MSFPDTAYGYECQPYPRRRSRIKTLIYWNRYHKYYMSAWPKFLWWAKFLLILPLLPEGLIDAVSAIPILGSPLIPVDVVELPAEGVSGAVLAWLIFKLACKLVFRYRKVSLKTFRELRDMRDYELYPPWPCPWVRSWD